MFKIKCEFFFYFLYKFGLKYSTYSPQLAEEIMVDLGRDFWIRETGTSQQVAQLHERYDDDDDDDDDNEYSPFWEQFWAILP